MFLKQIIKARYMEIEANCKCPLEESAIYNLQENQRTREQKGSIFHRGVRSSAKAKHLLTLLLRLMSPVTYCVRNVKAAEVIEDGRCSPLMISCHNFLLMTSTRPPRAITKLYNS